MVKRKSVVYKPLYKKLLSIKDNIQNRTKILKFKKDKWRRFIKNYLKSFKKYKKFKPKDQFQYQVSRFSSKGNSYKKQYKQELSLSKYFRTFYGGLSKKCIKNKLNSSGNKKINKSTNNYFSFIKNFECRLDVILYRAKFCSSIRSARQLISHEKIFVNKQRIKTKSYALKTGDLISVDTSVLENKREIFLNTLTWPIPPKYLIINYRTMNILLLNMNDINLSTYSSFKLNLEKVLTNYRYN